VAPGIPSSDRVSGRKDRCGCRCTMTAMPSGLPCRWRKTGASLAAHRARREARTQTFARIRWNWHQCAVGPGSDQKRRREDLGPVDRTGRRILSGRHSPGISEDRFFWMGSGSLVADGSALSAYPRRWVHHSVRDVVQEGTGQSSISVSGSKGSTVRFVFKASLGLLVASAALGQSWMHAPASADALSRMAEISQECPSVAVEASRGRTSKADVVMQRDAYWRALIAGRVTGKDGCAVRRT